jgi:ribosomal protein S18 acetylase RimI-like enzyme
MSLSITKASEQEFSLIWPIFQSIVKGGDTYVYSPDITEEDAKKVWFAPNFLTYIAREDDKIVGAYVIRPNHRDLGSHISNAAYFVAPEHRGKGYAKQMAEHSFQVAGKQGYKAMQFNYVISSNELAVKLWQALGFKIIGTVPEAHWHSKLGKYVDIHIMHRPL